MPFPGSPAGQWKVVLDPPGAQMPPSEFRTALAINDPVTGIQIGGTSSGQGIDWGTAEIVEYASPEGQWGSTVADYITNNRTITIPLGLGMNPLGPTADVALANLRAKVGLFQREGGWLMRQRNGEPAMYCDVVDAQLAVPDVWGETAEVEPGVTLTLITLPDWYGDEIALDSMSCTGICDGLLKLSGGTAVIEGDYPARTRIIVTNGTSQNIQGMWYGLRSRYYDGLTTDPLQIPGFGGSGIMGLQSGMGYTTSAGTKTGSQNPSVAHVAFSSYGGSIGNQAVYAYPATLPTHLGRYAVLARVQTTDNTDYYLGLTWKNMGLANATTNPLVQIPAAGYWYLVNLGVVNLEPPPVGGNAWFYELFAQTVTSSPITADLWLDELVLVPLDEGAGQVQSLALAESAITEIRSDGAWGQYVGYPQYGQTPVLGDLPRLPPGGLLENRYCELLVRPTSGPVADTALIPFTVQVKYRPCYMFRP